MRRPARKLAAERSALRHEVARAKEKIARLAPGALSITSVVHHIRRMQLGSMLCGEGHVGEHVMLGLVINLPSFSNRGRS